MNYSTFLSIFTALALTLSLRAESTSGSTVQKPAEVKDPRAALFPVILYCGQKEHRDGINGGLLIFARWDVNPSNQILGIPGAFTDQQIITALKKFYEQWRPPANDPTCPRPSLILAQQNWGCGAGLYEPLKAISIEFGINVYQIYPVLTQFEVTPEHPTANDKRLGELLGGA